MSKQHLIKGWLFLLLCLGLLSLASCSWARAKINDPQAAPVSLSLDCHIAYRSSVTVGIEREETISFAAANTNQTIAFPELEFYAQYWAGLEEWEERGLKVSVSAVNTDEELAAQLYQISKTEALRNQFEGGHGFTGLNYIYHPTSRAEVQYWCVAN
jgi:hypothetical protein